jgi:hypothetical protein
MSGRSRSGSGPWSERPAFVAVRQGDGCAPVGHKLCRTHRGTDVCGGTAELGERELRSRAIRKVNLQMYFVQLRIAGASHSQNRTAKRKLFLFFTQ